MEETNSLIKSFHLPRYSDFPSIDIYLDQLVTYLDQNLKPFIGRKDDETPIITKTMINNYVKQQVIYAPIKKKYNKNHIASLFVICILKQVYSINNISDLISYALDRTNLEVAYNNFCNELESAVCAVFNGTDYSIDSKSSYEIRLIKSLVLTFAHKLYVENIFKFSNGEKE